LSSEIILAYQRRGERGRCCHEKDLAENLLGNATDRRQLVFAAPETYEFSFELHDLGVKFLLRSCAYGIHPR
jgi:hypothetical protein